MSKRKLPSFASDEEAEIFVETADLGEYDLSGAEPRRFVFADAAYEFEIFRDVDEKFRVRFKRGSEVILTTEAYASKSVAQQAIDAIKRNGPSANVKTQAHRSAA